MKVVIISNDRTHPGQIMLKRSLWRHGWDFVEICEPYRGFGYKINELAKYLRESGQEYFIMQDAFDTYCLLPPNDFPWQYVNIDGVVVSGEKQCWPDAGRAHHFTASSPWRYPNSGQVYGRASRFIDLVARYPVADADDDQRWYTDRAIAGEVLVDEECNLFQSIAFETPGDFDYFPAERFRLRNKLTGTFPLFAHGNGRTDMNKIYLL
jgi:hypothetical protein